MDTVLTWVLTLIGGLVVFLIVFNLGFKLHPKTPFLKVGEKTALQRVSLPESLPAPVYHFFESNYGRLAPSPRSVSAVGLGTFRVGVYPWYVPILGNRPIWAPMTWSLALIPGEEFVYRVRILWFRRSLLMGGDQLIKGVGRFQMSDKSLETEHMDTSEAVMMWMYTFLLAPFALLEMTGVQWEAVDDQTARLKVPHKGSLWEFTWHFDPQSGELVKVETVRPGSKSGVLYPFYTNFDKYRIFDEKFRLAGQFTAAWEEGVYVYYNLEQLAYNVDLQADLEEGI